jgi:MSHA biogenesis protein MshM
MATPQSRQIHHQTHENVIEKDDALLSPFPYADYVNAKKSLLCALQGPGFYGMVTGESGMGKTSLLRETSDALDRHRYRVLYLSSSHASRFGVVRCIAQRLHISPRCSHLETVDALAESISAHSSQFLLWIDEADQVETRTLQELRMLAESHLKPAPLFSLVLSGLPQLSSRLDDPVLFPLKRRISLRLVLTGICRDELVPFLKHRFGTRDAARVPQEIQDEIFERTKATPALIEQIVHQALTRNTGIINQENIHAILDIAGL